MDFQSERIINPEPFTGDLKNYKSRLCHHITGYSIETGGENLSAKILSDTKKFLSETGIPDKSMRDTDPDEYRKILFKLADKFDTKIISFHDYPKEEIEGEPHIKKVLESKVIDPEKGCYTKDTTKLIVVGDPNSQKSLGVIAHELVHAIDDKNQKFVDVETAEYRAYCVQHISPQGETLATIAKKIPGLFGDFMIAGSSIYSYMEKSDTTSIPDFYNKAEAGIIHIPWFSQH